MRKLIVLAVLTFCALPSFASAHLATHSAKASYKAAKYAAKKAYKAAAFLF